MKNLDKITKENKKKILFVFLNESESVESLLAPLWTHEYKMSLY